MLVTVTIEAKVSGFVSGTFEAYPMGDPFRQSFKVSPTTASNTRWLNTVALRRATKALAPYQSRMLERGGEAITIDVAYTVGGSGYVTLVPGFGRAI